MENGSFDNAFGAEMDHKYNEIRCNNYCEGDAKSHKKESNDLLNETITFEEVKYAIKEQNMSAKSFDIDGIHPSIINRMPDNAVKVLQAVFNLVINSGTWIWDTSNISFIKKDGKDN